MSPPLSQPQVVPIPPQAHHALPLTGKPLICGELYPGLCGVDRQKGRAMRECGVLCPQTSLAINPTLWETAHRSAGTYRVSWDIHGSLWMQRGKEVMAGPITLDWKVLRRLPEHCQVHGLQPLLYFVMTRASVALGQLLVNSILFPAPQPCVDAFCSGTLSHPLSPLSLRSV